jgi:hypothetical protein
VETDTILKETQTSDDLEGAIETMAIAVEEVNNVLGDIHDDSQIQNISLKKLHETFSKSLNDYSAGLSMQLNGIAQGDHKKIKDGYVLTEKSKKMIHHYYSLLNK